MLTIDEARGCVVVQRADGTTEQHALDRPQAFEAVAAAWLRCGWDAKYVYGFTRFGQPVMQLPEDMIRIQEVIRRLRPGVLVETGTAYGGLLIFCASLFEAMGHGGVIGIDVDIRKHDRAAIEAHPLAARVTLVEGTSTAPGTLAAVRHSIDPAETVMVILDSNHGPAHVAGSLIFMRHWSRAIPTLSPAAATWCGWPIRRAPRRTGHGPIHWPRQKAFWHATRNSCWRNRHSRLAKATCAAGQPTGRSASSGDADQDRTGSAGRINGCPLGETSGECRAFSVDTEGP
jgi:cephalosporin hydroxylase